MVAAAVSAPGAAPGGAAPPAGAAAPEGRACPVPGPRAGAGLSDAECASFLERGYLVFPGLLADEACALRTEFDRLLDDGGQQGPAADWNAVDTGGAELVPATDGEGRAIPGRVMKVQAAALGSGAVLSLLASPKVVSRVRGLYLALAQEIPEHVDVFGTKFFPMWPGGRSVSWHQDCHYFGTASPKIVSCGVYVDAADATNGCLRVVPGSHARGALPHSPGAGDLANGEWAAADEAEALDVEVPPGSVVLFNAMLLHAAHRNSHATKTRYSVFGHFVPASLGFSWRGVDFSRGAFKDRHPVY